MSKNQRRFAWITLGLWVAILVLYCGQVKALEIVLTSPEPLKSVSRVRISNITDNPQRKELDFRLSMGYVDANGEWVELKDFHELIANIPADDKNPAQPKYDNLQNLIKASGKTAEEIILNRAKAKFPGVVQ